MAEKFHLGLVQMSATADPDKNLQRAIHRLHQAAANGANIVCLPELFQTQYFCQREDAALFDLAESVPGRTTSQLAETAKLLHIVVIASLFEKRAPGVYHNTAVMIDADGYEFACVTHEATIAFRSRSRSWPPCRQECP